MPLSEDLNAHLKTIEDVSIAKNKKVSEAIETFKQLGLEDKKIEDLLKEAKPQDRAQTEFEYFLKHFTFDVVYSEDTLREAIFPVSFCHLHH